MASESPQYLRQLASAVETFAQEFGAFLALHDRNTSLAVGIAPAVFPKDGVTAEQIESASRRVARAAGAAADASRLTSIAFNVQGLAGRIDPIANWSTITGPKPVLDVKDILAAADQAWGQLQTLANRVEAEAPAPPSIGALHPLVADAARQLWANGHRREAVMRAHESVVQKIKRLTGRTDLQDKVVWQEAFSSNAPTVDSPRLRWPGPPDDLTVKSMNDGLRLFAPGLQLVVRNRVTHETKELSPVEGLERLYAISLLARYIDECELRSS